jgi:hypothetical protein
MLRLTEDYGGNRRYGRLLYAQFRAHKLINLGAEGRVFMWPSGSSGACLTRANYEQLQRDMLDSGYITQEKFDRDLSQLEAPDFLTLSPILWTVWGRRPPA